jgi:hypothetical protein
MAEPIPSPAQQDALADLAMKANEAIRAFPFWDYGMDDVDPNDEYAEWVWELAVKVADSVLAEARSQIAASLKRAAAGRREYAEGVPERKAGATASDASLAEMRETLLSEAACYESVAQIVEDPRYVMGAVPSWRWTDDEVASLYPSKESTDG